jgi:hypothetical protein
MIPTAKGPVRIVFALLVVFASSSASAAGTIRVLADPDRPQVEPIVAELRAADPHSAFALEGLDSLDPRGHEHTIVLSLLADEDVRRAMSATGCSPSSDLRPEGFSLRRCRSSILWVAGLDPAGLLYGGFELAEQLALSGWDGVRDTDQSPYLALRGTKFNLPLDVRTPTYSDPGESAQRNIPVMWDLDFWREYIDHLARHRYNFVSLWSLHPFPSLVKVSEYPDIALADVKRSTSIERRRYELSARGFDAPEIMRELETVKVMSIDEKIAHWRRVMAYGKARNVRFYLVTWNIYPYGVDGRYGITADFRNQTTIDYYRASVRQVFLTYPDLAGIGLTTGENMPGATFREKEEWAFQTYGRGVLDVAEAQPHRTITFIHRQHEAKATEISETFGPLIARENVDFIFSFKYAKAHAYSSTTQTYHPDFVADITAAGGLETIWTLRNDDNYLFRWGAPDFVREFIRNIPRDVSRGYYFGSDGYVWGREFVSRSPARPRRLEVEKHWYSWLLWGRLGYDPGLDDERLASLLHRRYPEAPGRVLFDALQDASMVYPLTTGFHWGALDFQWYVECSCSRDREAGTTSGYHDIFSFLSHPTHPGTDDVTIPEFVGKEVAGEEVPGTTPLEIADRIEEHARRALEGVASIHPGGNVELWRQLDDIRAMAHLGRHYSHKIRAATDLSRYWATNDARYRRSAAEEAQRAALHWRTYVSYLSAAYQSSIWLNRIGEVDWKRLYLDVLHDVRSVGGRLDIPPMEPTPGGTLLEAEAGRTDARETSARAAGPDGPGFLEFSAYRSGDRYVEWDYEAPADGHYVLEVQYSSGDMESRESRVVIDGEEAGAIGLWGTGGRDNWCWDRTSVVLEAGRHTLRLYPNAEVRIDYLNVIPIR